MSIIIMDNMQLYGGSAAAARAFWSPFTGALVEDPDPEVDGDVATITPSSPDMKHYFTPEEKSQGIGFSALVRMTLPTDGGQLPRIMRFSGVGSADGLDEIMFLMVLTTGHLLLTQSPTAAFGFTLGISARPVIMRNVWQHIEVYYYSTFNGTSTIEVRVEGEQVIYADGFSSIHFFDNTANDPSITAVSFHTRRNNIGAGPQIYMKDIVLWNKEGSRNNDFIGPLVIASRIITSGVELGGWYVQGKPTAPEVLTNTPSVPTEYVAAPAEFVHYPPLEVLSNTTTPPTSTVVAVTVAVTADKTDEGYGQYEVAVVSEEVSTPSEPQFIHYAPYSPYDPSTSYTSVPEDPATGEVWTPAGLDAASITVTRTE